MPGPNDGKTLEGQEQPGAAPEPVSPAVPAGQEQPPTEVAPQPSPASFDADKFRKEVLSEAQKIADKAAYRRDQELKDRVTTAEKRVDALAEQAEKAGQPLTDNQVDALKRTARAEAEQPEPERPADPIMAEVYAMQEKADTFIEDGDPEVSTIVLNEGLKAYFDSVEKAIAAKKVRLTPASQTNQPAATPDQARAATPSASGRTAQHLAASSKEYWENAHK